MRNVILSILFVGGAIIACAIELAVFPSRPPRPATVTDREIEVTEREIRLLASLEDRLEVAIGCTSRAKVIDMYAAEVTVIADDLAAMTASTPDHDIDADRWMVRYKPRLRMLSAHMRTIYRACKDDVTFVESFEPLRRLWNKVD